MPRSFVATVSAALFALLTCSDSRAEQLDRYGITQIIPTAAGGREWHAQWETARKISPYSRDPADPLFFNEDGELRIADGVADAPAGLTRLLVTSGPGAASSLPEWRNVEMTVYVRRGKTRKPLDYQAFYLSARSGLKHNDQQPCEGTSYHSTARFDGKLGFKKEIWHTGGYTGLQPQPSPRPWTTVPEGKWVGLKFICRNRAGDTQVHLQLYVDAAANNHWTLAAEHTDAGTWLGEKPGCDRPQNYIITEARPAVYFRTDEVDVSLKAFSVREIDPEP